MIGKLTGVVDSLAEDHAILDVGGVGYVVQCPTSTLSRLSPGAIAVEQAFVHKDPSAALKLGHARAIALLAGAQAGLEIAEYTPNHIKKCVVGAGHAGKEQVLFMVRRLLPACGVDQADAADALAAAIAHAHLSTTRARIMAAQ